MGLAVNRVDRHAGGSIDIAVYLVAGMHVAAHAMLG